MPDDPDRTHDTDPLADTQSSEDSGPISASSSGTKKRVVHAGDVLGRYELVEEIGEGGMATVFRAKDRELRREVAVKVLFPHLARRPDVVRRFHREARAAAGLEHANILRVYDVGGGEAEDPPYIVMELIRGHSLLAEIERRGPMLAELVACIGALLADALAVAHAAGIIHRDIKPANVMIDPGRRSESGALHSRHGGRVLLADFGVARLETEDSLVTKTGSVLGTPAYMSPEQASGDTATAKSDLYSLGATLYQLATGSLPYSGSPAKVIAQIAAGALVPAVRRRADVGPDLSRVIDRLMASDPKARPSSAADVAAELRALAAAGGFGDPSDELAAYFVDADGFVRDRLPKVVAALITTAERAIADDRLPRAMALADRATALAPEDPAVNELVEKVTAGTTSSRRKRMLAIAGGIVLVGAGASFGAMQLFGGGAAAPASDARAIGDGGAIAADASSAVDAVGASPLGPSDAGLVAVSPDAGRLANSGDAGAVAMVRDAGVRRVRRVPARVRDAAIVADAPAARPVDAAPRAVPVDAAPAFGFITVQNDTWCNVTIDGLGRGQIVRVTKQPLRVEAGRHVVTCEQPGTGNAWTRTVEVKPGGTAVARGAMIGTLAVTLEVNATIDGTAYRAGTVVKLRGGRHDLVIGGTKTFFTLRAACRVRTTPEPGCY